MKEILKKPIVITSLFTIVPLLTLIFLLSNTPFISIRAFLTGPFSSIYAFGNMLNRSVPLILTSLGAFIALRSNAFNLGGEGQVYIGVMLSGIVPILFPNINILALFIICMFSSGLLTLVSGILELKFNINSLISTYLISMIVIRFCNYLISKPFIEAGSNILGTKEIPESLKLLKILPPSSLTIGFFISIMAVFTLSFFIGKTIWGFKFSLSGRNSKFASLMDIDSKKYKLLGLTLSGAFHGLAGALFVTGNLHSAIVDSYIGLGWNGLSSGLLAGSNVLFVILTSMFYSYLDSGAQYATVVSDITIELSVIIKSILFFIISSRLIKNHFIKRGTV